MTTVAENQLGQITLNDLADSLYPTERTGGKAKVTSSVRT